MSNPRELIATYAPDARKLVPRGVDAERLLHGFLRATADNPDLVACTKSSMVTSLLDAATMGLDIGGPAGLAYVVPFRNTVKGRGSEPDRKVLQAQLIVGYKGWAQLVLRSPQVASLEADVVYEGDDFEYVRGTNPSLSHSYGDSPRTGGPGGTIGAYAIARMADGTVKVEHLKTSEIERIRNGATSGKSPAWRNHWPEMAKKTAFLRLKKLLPMEVRSPAIETAERLEQRDFEQPEVIEVRDITEAPPVIRQEGEPQPAVAARAMRQARTEAAAEELDQATLGDLVDDEASPAGDGEVDVAPAGDGEVVDAPAKKSPSDVVLEQLRAKSERDGMDLNTMIRQFDSQLLEMFGVGEADEIKKEDVGMFRAWSSRSWGIEWPD